jgi:hypothetical protein
MVMKMEILGTKMMPTNRESAKKALGPDDLLNAFKQNHGNVWQNHLSVLMLSTHISKPEGETPVWLFQHERSLAPIRRTIGDVQKNIRQGKLLEEDVGPRSMNLTAAISQLALGDVSASFYDFRTPGGRLSFAVLVGCGYKFEMSQERAPGVLSEILDCFKGGIH